uniref:Fork-head domain-containing protein n=1 Tax=Ciona savignyi TaxID=51511 RepID=H2Z827_CIOSA
MVLSVKSKLSCATVAVTKAGRTVTSVEKWKTDWFHEVSDLFHLTTDQVAPGLLATKPTLERARALESKAKLNTVLSLIERYIKSSIHSAPSILKNTNSNNVSTLSVVQSQNKQSPGGWMPWMMVDPNEVCPVDYHHQRTEMKKTWNIEEAVELLTADDVNTADLLSGPLTPDDSFSDSDDYISKFFPSITNMRSYESLKPVRPPPHYSVTSKVGTNTHGHANKKIRHELMENSETNMEILEIDRKRKRSDEIGNLHAIDSPKRPEANRVIIATSDGKRISVSRPVHGRKVLPHSRLLPGPNVLLKRLKLNAENTQQKQRSVSTDASANENTPSIVHKLGEPIRVRHASLQSPGPEEERQPISGCRLVTDQFDTIDFNSLFGFDDDGILPDDITVTSEATQFPPLTKVSSEEALHMFGHCNGILKEIEPQNKPKRKYTKKPKLNLKIPGCENEKELVKPPLPYNQLIYLAFKHASSTQLTVRQIYKFVTTRFPYYAYANLNWQNAIRHQLCCSHHYQKILLQQNDNACDKQGKYAWEITDQYSLAKLDEDLITHLEKDGILEKMKLATSQDTGDFEELFGE